MSHETIYRSLFIQARGALKKELTLCLRSKRTIRRSPQASRKGRGGGQIRDLISISKRPATVEDRAVPGHWEGDLLAGSKNTHIATLVERHSRYVMLLRQGHRNRVSALIAHARQLPGELYKSLTWDRGLEMADHKRFTLATDIDVYAIRRVLGNAAPMRTPTDAQTVLPQVIRTLTRAPGQDRSQAERTAPQDAGV